MRWRPAVLAALFVVLDVVVILGAYVITHREISPASSPSSTVGPGAGGTSPSATAGDNTWTGPLHLAASPNGAVVRATRGTCDKRAPVPSRVWISPTIDAPLGEVRVAGLQESLGLEVTDTSTVIIGAGPKCLVSAFTSTDRGGTWTKGPVPDDIWWLDRDTSQSVIHGPVRGGKRNLDCLPVGVDTLPDRGQALITCSTTYVLAVSSADRETTNGSYVVNAPVAAAVTPGKRLLALGATDTCGASLMEVVADKSPVQVACLGKDEAPLGLAVSGQRIFVEVGYRLLVSTDGGKRFTAYPPA